MATIACIAMQSFSVAQQLPVDFAMREQRVDVLLSPKKHDLHLLDGQKKKVEALVGTYRLRREEFRKTIGDENPQKYKLRGEWEQTAKRKLAEEICEDILLPHQVSRLTEIILQRRLSAGGVVAVLKSRDISEKVAKMKIADHVIEEIEEITVDANAEFRDARAELVKRFNEQMKLLEKRRSDEILKPLNEAQRDAYRKLFGPPIRESDAIRDMIDRAENRK